MRGMYRPAKLRVLGACRGLATVPVPTGWADRTDQGPFEGPVPSRPGTYRHTRSGRSPGSQQDLQLPRWPGGSGDRLVAAHTAAQRRPDGAVYGRLVGCLSARGDRTGADRHAAPEVGTGAD